MLGEAHTEAQMSHNDPLEVSALHLLHRAGQCAGDVFQAEMVAGDLTPRQFAVLVSVSQDEGLSQTSLVRKTGIDRSTLADIVRRMLRKGLLQRQRTKDDARAYSVKLTEEGWKALRQAQPTVEVVDSRVLSVLPEPDRGRFIADLTKIVNALSQPEAASSSSS
jgi:DNA-binding MarR family transcriptional regulator